MSVHIRTLVQQAWMVDGRGRVVAKGQESIELRIDRSNVGAIDCVFPKASSLAVLLRLRGSSQPQFREPFRRRGIKPGVDVCSTYASILAYDTPQQQLAVARVQGTKTRHWPIPRHRKQNSVTCRTCSSRVARCERFCALVRAGPSHRESPSEIQSSPILRLTKAESGLKGWRAGRASARLIFSMPFCVPGWAQLCPGGSLGVHPCDGVRALTA